MQLVPFLLNELKTKWDENEKRVTDALKVPADPDGREHGQLPVIRPLEPAGPGVTDEKKERRAFLVAEKTLPTAADIASTIKAVPEVADLLEQLASIDGRLIKALATDTPSDFFALYYKGMIQQPFKKLIDAWLNYLQARLSYNLAVKLWDNNLFGLYQPVVNAVKQAVVPPQLSSIDSKHKWPSADDIYAAVTGARIAALAHVTGVSDKDVRGLDAPVPEMMGRIARRVEQAVTAAKAASDEYKRTIASATTATRTQQKAAGDAVTAIDAIFSGFDKTIVDSISIINSLQLSGLQQTLVIEALSKLNRASTEVERFRDAVFGAVPAESGIKDVTNSVLVAILAGEPLGQVVLDTAAALVELVPWWPKQQQRLLGKMIKEDWPTPAELTAYPGVPVVDTVVRAILNRPYDVTVPQATAALEKLDEYEVFWRTAGGKVQELNNELSRAP